MLSYVVIERETVHGVRWTPVLHRPKPTLCGLRPRYPLAGAEPCRALLAQKKDIHSDIFFCATKSARRDSNPRPRPWQGRAPPTEPLAHVLRFLNARPILPKTTSFVNSLFYFIFFHSLFYFIFFQFLTLPLLQQCPHLFLPHSPKAHHLWQLAPWHKFD